MIDSKKAYDAIKLKLSGMSVEEVRSYLDAMGYRYVIDDRYKNDSSYRRSLRRGTQGVSVRRSRKRRTELKAFVRKPNR